jgi:hypothetical protein
MQQYMPGNAKCLAFCCLAAAVQLLSCLGPCSASYTWLGLLSQVSQSLAASLSAGDVRRCLAVLLLAGQLLTRGTWRKGCYLAMLQQARSAWQEGHAGDQAGTVTMRIVSFEH